MRVCSFKVPFLRVRELLYCFVCMPLYGWKKHMGGSKPQSWRNWTSYASAPCFFPWFTALSTCVDIQFPFIPFPSFSDWVTQPWASSLHNLSCLLPPHPRPVGLPHFKYSLLLSLLLMYSLPQPSHWRSLFTLTWISKGCISFLGFMLVFPLKETLSLRWKQPLFFPLYLFLFQLSFHLCTVAIFSQ